jgi:molybdate transport system ATP-binding protein
MSETPLKDKPSALRAGASAQDPFLRATIRHKLDGFDLNAQISLTQPWTWLFGPSGAGKTTLLRILCGLTRPNSARIQLGREIICDTIEGIYIPTHQRGIGMVMQQPLLFPHWTVEQNIRFALTEQSRLIGNEMAGAFDDQGKLAVLLERFHIAPLAAKKPDSLSGGERQRVVLARAVAAPAKFMLLDEPLTGLDISLRDELMTALRSLLARRGTPVFAVTHDASEVFSSRAEVLVIDAGRITAQGPPETVLAAQRTLLLDRLQAQ